MKYLAKLFITMIIALAVGALIDGAHASVKKKASFGGDALKPKTSLKFDGRSVVSLRAGKYDSLSMGDEGAKGAKRLYSLPANFQPRAADSESEMRYRQ